MLRRIGEHVALAVDDDDLGVDLLLVVVRVRPQPLGRAALDGIPCEGPDVRGVVLEPGQRVTPLAARVGDPERYLEQHERDDREGQVADEEAASHGS